MAVFFGHGSLSHPRNPGIGLREGYTCYRSFGRGRPAHASPLLLFSFPLCAGWHFARSRSRREIALSPHSLVRYGGMFSYRIGTKRMETSTEKRYRRSQHISQAGRDEARTYMDRWQTPMLRRNGEVGDHDVGIEAKSRNVFRESGEVRDIKFQSEGHRGGVNTAQRLAVLSRVYGVTCALSSEWDEAHLLPQLIVETARDLIGATFAALTLRPVNEEGEAARPFRRPPVSSCGHRGSDAKAGNELRRMPLGGEGLLLPIFRHGVSVLSPTPSTPSSTRGVTDDGTPQAAAKSGCGGLCPRTIDCRRVTRSGQSPWTSYCPQFSWCTRA